MSSNGSKITISRKLKKITYYATVSPRLISTEPIYARYGRVGTLIGDMMHTKRNNKMSIIYCHQSLRRQHSLRLVVCLSVVVGVLLPLVAWAEGYVSGFAGVNLPQDLTNIEGVGSPPNTTRNIIIEDLKLQNAPIAGVKLGYYLPGKLRWLGAELESFYTNPHIKQQRFSSGGAFRGGAPTFTVQGAAGSHMRVATQALNVVVRYPGESFQPYAGMGLGVFWGRTSGFITDTGSDVALGMNFLTGLRYMVTPEIAMFGEYKYVATTFDYGGTAMMRADYQAHHFVFGLGYHF